jgi:hypothetical protein
MPIQAIHVRLAEAMSNVVGDSRIKLNPGHVHPQATQLNECQTRDCLCTAMADVSSGQKKLRTVLPSYCTVLYCTVLYWAVLYSIVLYYIVLRCVAGSDIFSTEAASPVTKGPPFLSSPEKQEEQAHHAHTPPLFQEWDETRPV